MLHSNNLKTPGDVRRSRRPSRASRPSPPRVKPGANKGEYEVTLQVAKDAKPGDLDGTVKIYTNDKVNPIVTVPVKARSRPRTARPQPPSK